MTNQPVSYAELKALIAGKGLTWQYRDRSDRYDVFAVDSSIMYSACIYKDGAEVGGIDFTQEAVNRSEFETSYKPTANTRISQQLDSDGAPMSRVKVAPSGWNFNLRMFEVRLSTIGSLVNQTVSGVDAGDVTVKLYNAAGGLITDSAIALATDETGCVKTVIDLEPPYDIYIAGGNMRAATQTTEDVRVSVIGVPDIPAAYGGSKSFVQSINMKYIPIAQGVNADGRAAKWLQYSATLHTNKIRFQFTHPAGYQLWVGIMMETYKQ